MPIFYFHTVSDVSFVDAEGTELANMDAARVAALEAMANLLQDERHKFWGSYPWSMTVTDKVGLILFSLELHGHNAPAGQAVSNIIPLARATAATAPSATDPGRI